MRTTSMRFAAIAAVALMLAACSSGKTLNPGAAGSGSPTGTATASPSQTGTPGAKAPTARGTSSSPKPGSKTTSPRPNRTPTFGPSSARLDKSCVRRAASDDPQGVTIHTDPGGPASYHTVYSDGTSIIDRPQEYSSGGQGGGFADSSGRFRQTWVVPSAAPLGPATVRVTVAGRTAPIELKFTIVATNARCS